jgi:ribosomal protein S18 acetylase RimI-like enzyme
MVKIRKIKKPNCANLAMLANEFTGFLDALEAAPSKTLSDQDFLTFGFGKLKTFDGLIAEQEKKAVGYLLYSYGFETQFAQRYIILEDLFVTAEKRNCNIGKSLCDKLIVIAQKNNCANIRVSVWSGNMKSAHFYQKLGFMDYERQILPIPDRRDERYTELVEHTDIPRTKNQDNCLAICF